MPLGVVGYSSVSDHPVGLRRLESVEDPDVGARDIGFLMKSKKPISLHFIANFQYSSLSSR